MIAKLLPLFILAASVSATKPYLGVDPNTLACDPLGQIFLLLPSFTDCSKFHMCANGIEVEFSCPGGLIFDFELQGCNYKWDVTCQLRDPNLGIEGSGDNSVEWAADEADDNRLIASEVTNFSDTMLNCAINSNRQVSFKGDCQRYWKCENGSPQAQYCSDGLFFNEKSQQCDFEANVKCNVEVNDELTGEYIVS